MHLHVRLIYAHWEVSADCCYACALTHANVLGSVYAGCFLYFVMSYAIEFKGDFDCDSCKAMFGASFELCALFVVDCLTVGGRFRFSRCFNHLRLVSPGCV